MPELSFEAVIFDLDGVITRTALVHSAAWKKMFNEYLKYREAQYGEVFREFSHDQDYLKYVDGKPRYKGVASFLESRNISIPFGNSDDPIEKESICALGNRKNLAFFEVLEQEGVKPYESTVLLIKELITEGIKIGVASSSRNCKVVLEKAGLEHLFQTRVDGLVSEELGLNGKPEPDIFTRAADNLNVNYDRTVIVEDAVSGVQAGSKGNFGLVLGIARENNHNKLRTNGADIVVSDLSETGIDEIEIWFKQGLHDDSWRISYSDYDPEKEKSRESLLTTGNGFFGSRGAMEESISGPVNYPGTYIAGLYNKLKSKVGDKAVINEDFVNCPNWVHTIFKINNENWIDINKVKILNINRTLDLRTGVLSRVMTIRDDKDREMKISSQRISGMHNCHLAALKYEIVPLNFSGTISLRSGLKGDIINEGVERYSMLNQRHLEPLEQGGSENFIYLLVKTTQSDISIAQAAKFYMSGSNGRFCPVLQVSTSSGSVYAEFQTDLAQNEPMAIEKIVSLFTSKDHNVTDPLKAAKRELRKAYDFSELLERSSEEWKEIWHKADIKIDGDRLAQKLIRLHIYHMMVTASKHNTEIDAGIPARGLHGEAYRGHIFWDELYILPFYNIHFSEVSRSVLMHRYRRLKTAKEYAEANGYKGAMYPWQSGSDGSEETQLLHLNPRSGKWGEDYSSLQRHISIAVAYNVWQYYNTTLDDRFLASYGAEMFLEICRFWASKSILDSKTDRYSIDEVMGPDEFHEKYPDSDNGGLRNNAYTNLMVSWLFEKAIKIPSIIGKESTDKLFAKTGITIEEVQQWQKIGSKLQLNVSADGIIAQFDGYFDLKELNWDAYREKYGNIYRMDRILKAEGKSPDEYKVAKQADLLMTLYALDSKDVVGLADKLGYILPKDFIEKNLQYYIQRTSHGSTLSKVVHAKLALLSGDLRLGHKLFRDALISDFSDSQGGTTAEGIHCGLMASTALMSITDFAGVDIRQETLSINPSLPEKWRNIKFQLSHRNIEYHFEISKKQLRLKTRNNIAEKTQIIIRGKEYLAKNNEWLSIIL